MSRPADRVKKAEKLAEAERLRRVYRVRLQGLASAKLSSEFLLDTARYLPNDNKASEVDALAGLSDEYVDVKMNALDFMLRAVLMMSSTQEVSGRKYSELRGSLQKLLIDFSGYSKLSPEHIALVLDNIELDFDALIKASPVPGVSRELAQRCFAGILICMTKQKIITHDVARLYVRGMDCLPKSDQDKLADVAEALGTLDPKQLVALRALTLTACGDSEDLGAGAEAVAAPASPR